MHVNPTDFHFWRLSHDPWRFPGLTPEVRLPPCVFCFVFADLCKTIQKRPSLSTGLPLRDIKKTKLQKV